LKRIYLIVLVLVAYNYSFSQIQIKGVILDNIHKKPIEGAEINYNYISQNFLIENQTYSQKEGSFTLNVKNLPLKLKISSPIYYTKTINLKKLSTKLEIFLTNKGIILDEIIVKSEINSKKLKYASSSISLINNLELRKLSDLSIEPGLNDIPGVHMHSGALNTNRITIRGMGSRSPYTTNKIKSYLNDIPLSNGVGETSIEDLGIDLFNQIEIIKGPNSNIYGAGLGGAILLNLDEAKEHNFSYTSFLGSFRRLKNRINLYNKFKKIETQIQFQNLLSDGYRENNKYIKYNAFFYLGYEVSDNTKLNIIYNFINLDAQIPSSLDFDTYNLTPSKAAENWKNIEGDEKYNKDLLGVSINYNASKYNLKTSIFYNNYNSDENRPFNYLIEKSFGFGTRIINTIKKSNHVINFGLEFYRENYLWKTFNNYGTDTEEKLTDQDEKRNNLLLFSKYEINLNATTNINFGISSNYIKYNWKTLEYDGNPQALKNNNTKKYKFNNIVSPKISINKILFDKNIYFTISHGYSPPNIDETLDDKGLVNLNIKPETGWNIELGTLGDFFENAVSYNISLYLMKIKNLLVAQRTAEDTYVGVNAGKTSHPGIEITINSTIWDSVNGKNKITSEINIFKNWYRFIDFVNEDIDYSGNIITGVPSFKISKNLVLDIGKFKTIINIKSIGKIPINDSNDIFSNQYTLLNLTMSNKIEIKKFEIRILAGIKNLTNKKYTSMILINAKGFGGKKPRYYYPGLPRNYFISLITNI